MSAPLSDLAALTGRELRRYARDRAYWVGQIVFPLAFIAFIGYGLEEVIALPSGTSYVGHLASGLLAMLVGSGAVAVVAITAIFVALGVAIAVPLRRLDSFRLIAAMVTVPLYLCSGIFYPVATLPAPTRWIAHVNPLTYGVDLLRYALLGVHELPLPLSYGVLGALTVVAIGAAVVAFDRGTRG